MPQPANTTPNFRRILAIGLVALALVLTGFIALNIPLLRTASALVLVFFLPGYAWQLCLFAQRPSPPKAEEQLLISTALSMALSIIGGLLINLLPTGLQQQNWYFYAFAVVALGSLLALFIPNQTPLPFPTLPKLQTKHQVGNWVMICLAIGAVWFGINLARTSISTPQTAGLSEGYTLLWMQPQRDEPSKRATSAQIGLHSQEFSDTTYQLRLEANGELLHEWQTIRLTPNEKWQSEPVALPTLKANTQIEALLYRKSDPKTIYRKVTFWANGE